MKDVKLFKRINIRRWAVILLMLLIILALVFGQAVFASNDGGPIRSAHKVKAGEKSFCFFVANNVTLTQSELAEMDDETLVKEILKRTGLFIKEASCNDPAHPLISVDQWTAAGNTLGLSEEDIASLRAAAPTAGKSAKFHLDVQFTLKPEEKESPADDQGKDEDPGEEPATDPTIDPRTDPSVDPGDDPAVDPAIDPGTDPADDHGDPSGDPSDDPATDPSGNPVVEPTDDPAGGETGDNTGDPSDDPAADPAGEPGNDPAGDPDDPATDPTDEPGTDPSGDPADDPATDPTDDPTVDPEEEQPEEREIYTTYKLTSPELLFIVVLADEDAGATEDECEPVEPALPEEPEIPEIPDIEIPDISEPTEMLPEYRKIDMVDKSGAPLTPVLEDGEPVELVWIEPKNTIDPEKAKNWIESFPGGELGFGGLIAALAAAGIAVFVANRKKDDEY